MLTIGLLGTVPESVREALRANGHNVVESSQHEAVDVLVAHARGDWPSLRPTTFAKCPIIIAVCDTFDDVASAYRAGAYFTAPPDPEVVNLLVERAEGLVKTKPLADLEKEAILSAMKASAGSTARAAAMLDISVRKVQYKLHEYGVPLARRGVKASSSSGNGG